MPDLGLYLGLYFFFFFDMTHEHSLTRAGMKTYQ